MGLVQSLLDGRREAEALEEARLLMSEDPDKFNINACFRYAAKFHEITVSVEERSPAVSFLLGRCLLRLGHRAEGITALEVAEKVRHIC